MNEHRVSVTLATVRKDLRDNGFKVPVGKLFYGAKIPLPYRWLNDDQTFQIFYKKQWRNAYSVDWDF